MGRPVRAAIVVVAAVALLGVTHVDVAGAQPGIDRVDLTQSDSERSPRRTKRYTAIGELSIPSLRVTSPIFNGVTMDVFSRGMGYWPGTALPGEPGNLVLAGHRTSRPRPLYDIQKLKIGDPIVVRHAGKVFTYRVTSRKVVTPTAIWITRPTKEATLTMFACHPRGSIKYRYVVFAKLSQ